MEQELSKEARAVLESLAKLPKVRYGFVPGYEGNKDGNSSILITRVLKGDDEGDFIVQVGERQEPVAAFFQGMTPEVVKDGNGFKCVRGTDKYDHVRELAPMLTVYYDHEDPAQKILTDELTA